MMNSYWGNYAGAFVPGLMAGWLSIFLIPLAIWSLFWMGLALWKAARNGSKVWFIVLLLVHTMGILDIIYILFFSKSKEKNTVKTAKKH